MSSIPSSGTAPARRAGLVVLVDGAVPPPLGLLRVRGELDLATAPELARALDLAAADRTDILLDLSGVTFCDLVGLTALELAGRRLRASGCRLSLRGVDGPLHLLLSVPSLVGVLSAHLEAATRHEPAPRPADRRDAISPAGG